MRLTIQKIKYVLMNRPFVSLIAKMRMERETKCINKLENSKVSRLAKFAEPIEGFAKYKGVETQK